MQSFDQRKNEVESRYEALIARINEPAQGNGVYTRYKYPIVTADTVPPIWKYDFNPATNPFFMERIGVNATLNSGAIKFNGKYYLMVRVRASTEEYRSPSPITSAASSISHEASMS